MPVAAGWATALTALAIWLLGTSTASLREQLKLVQFWSLEACVFVGILCAAWIARTAARQLAGGDAWRMALLGALALALTLFVAPRTNRIFYDEQIYQNIGQNLADLRLAQMCNDGNVEYGRLRCQSGEYNKQPYAYPHLLSLAYRLSGVHDATAFAVNAFAMVAIVCAVYLLTLLLFSDRDAATFAALILALTPHQIIWSATAAVEPTASLAAVGALLAAAWYGQAGRMPALAAALVSAAYAIQFRPESLLILPVAVLLAWPRLRQELRYPRAWWMGLLFLALVAVPVAHLFAVRNQGWGAAAARFSLDYLPGNLKVNGWFYLYDERFPALFTTLAVLGLLWKGAASRPRLAMALYFALFFAIDLVFYAGSYNYGADVRYSVLTYPPMAVLAGLGVSRLAATAGGFRRVIPPLALTVLAFVFLWHAPVVRATTEEAWAARADVRFARAVAGELPANAYVLTHNPGMFQVWGVNAGQLPVIVQSDAYVRFLTDRYTGGVFIHWNFWCNVDDPVHPEFCRRAMSLGKVELVREHRERDQRFAFYRIAVPPS